VARRKEELASASSSTPTLKKDEPEAKKRRQDMDDEEGKMFDTWIEEIKQKRFELVLGMFHLINNMVVTW
jgi:hypothetical protein